MASEYFPNREHFQSISSLGADAGIKTSADTSDPILEAAKKLATVLRERRAFTNTATFDLKCEVSGIKIYNDIIIHVAAAMWKGPQR